MPSADVITATSIINSHPKSVHILAIFHNKTLEIAIAVSDGTMAPYTSARRSSSICCRQCRDVGGSYYLWAGIDAPGCGGVAAAVLVQPRWGRLSEPAQSTHIGNYRSPAPVCVYACRPCFRRCNECTDRMGPSQLPQNASSCHPMTCYAIMDGKDGM